MADSKIESLPLRDRLTGAERVARELKEHLEQAVVTRTNELRRVTKRRDESDQSVTDKTVRDTVDRFFESEEFTTKLYSELMEYLDSIHREVSQMVDDAQPV